MQGFVIALVFVLWMAAFMAPLFLAISDKIPLSLGLIGTGAVFVIGFGFIFQADIDAEKRGPCVSYETQMHYNAATKTMMPARVCVQRGEWVEPTVEGEAG